MQITFVSNYINHHQLPLSQELYRLCGGNYIFLQTEPMTEERKAMGWGNSPENLPFVRNYWDDMEGCQKLLMDSEVVIFGGAEDEELIIPRLEAGKFTIRYSERLYKEGRYKFVSPRGLLKKYHDHIRFRKSPVYMLCAGGYTAGDFSLIHAYPHKLLEFGYFPETFEYDDVHELRKYNEVCEILWVSRYIDWKHPELMTKLAHRLNDENKNCHITMIGRGELWDDTVAANTDLIKAGKISFVESMTPGEVRERMRQADIFVLTSDGREGWGAVVNEAMNSGCAVLASHEVGAAPVLIDNKVNGIMFKSNDIEDLYYKISELLGDKKLRYSLGNRAYETIVGLWNSRIAAERLMAFVEDSKHTIPSFNDNGPMNAAQSLSFGKVLGRIK